MYSAIDAIASPAALEFSARRRRRRQANVRAERGHVHARTNAPAAESSFCAKTAASWRSILCLRSRSKRRGGGHIPGRGVLWTRRQGIRRFRGLSATLSTCDRTDGDRRHLRSRSLRRLREAFRAVLARREGRRLDCAGQAGRLSDGTGGVHVPSRRRRSRRPIRGARDRSGEGADRAHAPGAFARSASRPMRISVQARHPQSGDRWQRSIYLDAEPRDVIVPFDEMTPVGSSGRLRSRTRRHAAVRRRHDQHAPGTAGKLHDRRICGGTVIRKPELGVSFDSRRRRVTAVL